MQNVKCKIIHLIVSRSFLSIAGLHVSVAGKEIVRGIDLAVRPGELHVLMGPNGAGKSTLVQALMGHPACTVPEGRVHIGGKNLLALAPHERAQAGLFLAFQHPREIAGITVSNFLYAAKRALRGAQESFAPLAFHDALTAAMRLLHIDSSFAERFVGKGMSGGEKKKLEILQLLVLRPRLALLDETDSGLDLDALKIVALGIQTLRKEDPSFAAILVTHNVRLLKILKPDHLHVMMGGKIVESGRSAMARRIETKGFTSFRLPVP